MSEKVPITNILLFLCFLKDEIGIEVIENIKKEMRDGDTYFTVVNEGSYYEVRLDDGWYFYGGMNECNATQTDRFLKWCEEGNTVKI